MHYGDSSSSTDRAETQLTYAFSSLVLLLRSLQALISICGAHAVAQRN